MIEIKTFVCALLILAILISGFVTNYIVLKNKALVLSQKLEVLKNEIKSGNQSKINQTYEDILHHWKKHNKYMLMFSNHSNLDSISVSMIRIKEKLINHKYEDAGEEIELTLASLSSIAQNETLRLENIF